ncbi:SRPBCC domain-containing protein [Mucilaginibacter hurinus]|uniref:SRPBCC domain-containing protein n=1 Tax=Mucilaginibacter hurinus TaxID=2201324 RepID=A0A367GQB0_9SPHI|nr:SRPBCC domain-containing protein [Mucilaginibacter hurinus]RCH54893.1 SRPBCC domain-containing protein [Mucilaginibacter hurinus]
MENKILKMSADINAPAEAVWDVLVKDELNRQWYAAFSEGSHAETDWQQGSRVIFTDDSKRGVTGILTTVEPYKIIYIDYDGEVVNGQAELNSQDAMVGAHESYVLAHKNGVTHLDVELGVPDEYAEMMEEMWKKALPILKQLAENLNK